MGNILNITDEEIKALTNLSAFNANFGAVRIEHYRKGEPYYIWFPYNHESYIQECSSLEYLNGWLYGCVQGVLVVRHRAKEYDLKEESEFWSLYFDELSKAIEEEQIKGALEKETCKDCEHRGVIYENGECYCEMNGTLKSCNFYCKDFRKRDDENE